MVMIEPGGDPETKLFAVPSRPRKVLFTRREAARELGISGDGAGLVPALIAGANITTFEIGNALVIDDIGMEQLRTAYQRYLAGRSGRGRPLGRRNTSESKVLS
jgi:hypothetical protein